MSNMKKITELYKDESFRNEFLNNYEAAGESRQQAEIEYVAYLYKHGKFNLH